MYGSAENCHRARELVGKGALAQQRLGGRRAGVTRQDGERLPGAGVTRHLRVGQRLLPARWYWNRRQHVEQREPRPEGTGPRGAGRHQPGVVALGLPVGDRIQVSANLEGETTPEELVAAVAAHAPVVETELVGLDARYID